MSAEGELRHGWSLTEQVSGFRWDATGEALYAITPATGDILRLQLGSNAMRRLASLPRGGGSLSGLALDTQGGVWTTQRDGWSLVRFDAHGNLDRMIGLPVPSPSDLCFGGKDGSTLYITSSRQELKLEVLSGAPDSGCLQRLEAEVAGQPVAMSNWRL
ncbi:SMP-30/gluconolactonase/LRE family protein [Pseudomonas hefeiensis]|uniref:SMP-30/gluconolactonase/LRE family protein n=1 Tax=Pseudomonas hefeiensis TaxID=2738125 RepID=A0ABY9GGH9_9PSED|nr:MULTISPECIES: SMP-30/gluconolactonase/LRE family protein [unclassified Pseudomonas]WLH14764.1 SMP-30/gluconolactonase/LRE family protein [Pseudomonas sp. FP205]WLH97817.1 SMP-30/gluconolactonase/LRE family protein [Pseudomonas sp. FP53]WLI42091.1 SMP-30/gluconolactonase/LRE family protein [Pseudomonas sp. FP821]